MIEFFMKTLKCACGKDILVDDEDLEKVLPFYWGCWSNSVTRSIFGSVRPMTWLVLFKPKNGNVIDHKDRDNHNNQKSNLREATKQQNFRNQRPSKNGSGAKGVYWQRNRSKWQAQITLNYKVYHLGTFDKKEDAIAAYNKKAKELHGDFAYENI